MKKIRTALLAFVITMVASMCAMAGTFDGFWDFQQEDGTFAYGFPRVLVAMDKVWYRNTRVILGEGGQSASFYHKGSYSAYAEEGMVGGLLFTIGASVNTDFQDLPHFVYLGFDEEEAMNYYAALPTDYQAYMGDEAIRSEYDELWSGVEDVLASAVVKGSDKFRERNAPKDDNQPQPLMSGDYYYSINNGTATIVGIVRGEGGEDEIEIPSEIDGYQVTEIGAGAFWGKEMKRLLVPDTITRIGEWAFECCKITDSLALPENVIISSRAFSDARGLPPAVTIPAGATVEESAFSYCDPITEVDFGPGAVVKSRAFIYCDALNRVVFAEGCRLETKAFEYCAELSEVIYSGSVEAEEDAFLYCGEIEESSAVQKPQTTEAATTEAAPQVISSGDYDYSVSKENEDNAVIVKYNGEEEAVELPAEIDGHQVTEIGPEAFRYRKLKSVTLPDSIRVIGIQAFEYCEITEDLLLPEGITISEDAFSYAVLPAVVTIPAGAAVEKCAFSYCKAVERVCVESDAVIEGRAFGYCDDLTQVICADGSRLEKNAFEFCRGMKRVFLCGDVMTEEESFNGCSDAELTAAQAEEYDALKRAAPDELVDAMPYDAEERILEIIDSSITLDGVTVTLENASAKRDPETGGFTYALSGTIENNSEEGIMQVTYTFALIDENGEEFRSFAEVYDGEDTALPPHAQIKFLHDGIKWGKQSVPAAVRVGISSVKTETELPPVHVPEAGEFLYQALGDERLANIKEEPPAELSFHVDQGGYGRTATFREGEALDRAIELFCAIQIKAESGEWVTDNYNGIELKWSDGSYTGISLNLHNLEYWIHSAPRTYELAHLDEFWSYCAGYLTEDAPYDQEKDVGYDSTDPGMS